jgi:catabolite regulation protein CreA
MIARFSRKIVDQKREDVKRISPAIIWDCQGTGGVEDTSDADIACRQIGPIKIVGEIKDGERIFDEHRSLGFKKLQVVRFSDRERQVLVWWPTAID